MNVRQKEIIQLAQDLGLKYKGTLSVGFPLLDFYVGRRPMRMFGNYTDSNLIGTYNNKEIRIYDNSSYLITPSSTYIIINGKQIFPKDKLDRKILDIKEINAILAQNT